MAPIPILPICIADMNSISFSFTFVYIIRSVFCPRYAFFTVKATIITHISVKIKRIFAMAGSVNLYAQKSKQAAKEKSRYAMEESPRATSRCFMFMYFLLPH